jgi:D-proline reductase (dithiol) PrdB
VLILLLDTLSARHLSFMGSITAPGRMTRDYLPDAVEIFLEDHVDLALLFPV